MTKKLLSQILAIAFIFSVALDTNAQRRKKKSKKDANKTSVPKPKSKPKKGSIQPYNKVVTKDHKTDNGLFDVHKKDGKYLFEIPNNLLGREMLMVTRIAKTANGIGFGGGKQNTQVLRWERKENLITRSFT